MKVAEYISRTAGWLLIAAVLAIGFGFMFGVPQSGLYRRVFDFLFVDLSYELLKTGVPQSIVSTAGHIPHFTVVGVLLFFVLPAICCFVVAGRLHRQLGLNDKRP